MTKKQTLLALEAALLVARHEIDDPTLLGHCGFLLAGVEALLDSHNEDGTFGQTLVEQAEACVLLAQAPEVFGADCAGLRCP